MMSFLNLFKSPYQKPPPLKREIENKPPLTIHSSLEVNLDRLVKTMNTPADLVIHRFINGDKIAAAVVYLKSMVQNSDLGTHVIDPLNQVTQKQAPSLIQVKTAITAPEILEYSDLNKAISKLLDGYALILIEDSDKVLGVSFPGFPRRPIEEPITEKIIRGPREGFTEALDDNISLLRRWIKDPNLMVEGETVGIRTQTALRVMYLKDVANPEVVQEVHRRLNAVQIDGIIDSGYLSQLITDNRWTIFPLIQETERPDKVAAAILEGRVAIVVDKSPFVLIVPVTSTELYQIPEDFYLSFWVGTFIRILRGIGTFVSLTLPGLYITAVSVNSGLFPTQLIQVLASGRTGVPYPAIVELLLAFIIFEIFREAVVRVPLNINLVLGIAGGVLLGLVAMFSGLIGGPTIIVVIISTLSSFTTANIAKEQAWRVVRYFMLLMGTTLGVLGLTLGGIIILTHMAALNSFGVSYLGPWAPPIALDILDAYFVIPWWASFRRPPTYRPQDEDRLGKPREGGDQ
ncbi:MAG TPA: spore germination protein [Bacillota bacterium]|nr:spore germination protein [Bacillota bacterium]